MPDGDVAEALKDATFAKGDKVICAEWFDDSPPPAPRWYGDQLRRAMTPPEYEQINQTIDRVADRPQAEREFWLRAIPQHHRGSDEDDDG